MDTQDDEYKITAWDLWDHMAGFIGGFIGLAIYICLGAALVSLIVAMPVSIAILAGASLVAWAVLRRRSA